jgi:3-dehydroquinate synthase
MSIDSPLYMGNIAAHLSQFLATRSYSQIIILTDNICQQYCLPVLLQAVPVLQTAPTIVVPTGEMNKNIATCSLIWRQLLALSADRHALLLNLGGGVIGDMGGFAAATYKRGIAFVQIPTTLLAQVDAAIGSKVGIDFDDIKNAIGLFQAAQALFIDPLFLPTLAHRQVKSGYAEMFKHALIADQQHYLQLIAHLAKHSSQSDYTNAIPSERLIWDSINIKRNIVAQDPKEQGLRKVLNFGHTIGHAIESYALAQYSPDQHLLHGEAIAWGMIMELHLSQQICGFPQNQCLEISQQLKKWLLPPNAAINMPTDAILNYIQNDKKNKAGKWQFTLLQQIAQPVWDASPSPEMVKNTLNWCFNQQ